MKRVRLVTFAWGESYVQELLDIAVPAVLAPGNLPALVREFECDFVLLTERRLFDSVKAHPTYERLARLCPVRLVAIDDLLAAPLYGLALTYASYRAFEDLGEEVTRTSLLYFNSDWILADGAYRSLIPLIHAGEKLVVSPTYCVVTERVMPRIQARLAQGEGVLSVPMREMADWTIRNRHNTIRGKTANRRLFHMDVMDQFYWRVDATTLLCHQMPIAIVCMTPERAVKEPDTFWDYGTVSELCPNTPPKVLADSDQFLIMELRGEETYAEGLRLGWPSVADVGRHLASFVTRDHLDYGRFQLCLHSGELPAALEDARAQLRKVVEEAYAQIPAPKDHRAHNYWWPQKNLFDYVQRDYRNRDTVREWRWGFRASPYTGMLLAEMKRLDRHFARSDDADRERAIAEAQNAIGASVGQLEGLFSGDVHALRKALQVRGRSWRIPAERRRKPLPALRAAPPPPHGKLRQTLHALRAAILAPHALNPERALVRPLQVELSAAPAGTRNRMLVVASTGHDLAERTLRNLGHGFDVADVEEMLGWAPEELAPPRWDTVVFDLARDELIEFRTMLRALLPVLSEGARVLLLYAHRGGALALDASTLVGMLPPTDSLSIRYAGSPAADRAIRVYDGVRRRIPRIALAGFNLSPLFALALAAPFALAADRAAPDEGEAGRLPPSCASMVLSFSATAEVRGELEGW